MFTKKFARNCAVLVLSAFGVLGLASCNNANNGDNGGNTPDIQTPETTYTVKFMIQDANNAWTVLIDKKTTDGKVELPTAPAKKYYTFAGWYTTEALTEEFNENSVKANANAYAKYIPQEVKVHINDDPVVTKNLVDVVNAVYNPGEGLKFDGWYKDANYSVQWNGTDVVKDLYAKSVALITFNNGYEDVYTMAVKPGTVVANPAETEVDAATPEAPAAEATETTKTTLEAKEIVEAYMDPLDIHYVNADGTTFDFTKPVEKNTTITVNWNSLGLSDQLSYYKDTDTYFLEVGQITEAVQKAPVFSVQSTITQRPGKPSHVTLPEVDKNTVRNVEVFSAYAPNLIPSKAKKLIFGEGIKYIGGLSVTDANSVEDIVLPKSLKIIDNSFNNLPSLKGINLPEGLEVIIGSFFKESYEYTDHTCISLGSNYDFDIEVPASVKNIAMAPTNLKFAEGSKFFKGEDNRIYLNTEKGKVLISDTNNYGNRTIVVPNDVAGIQVGTYEWTFDYLYLPASFKFANYNVDLADYPYCKFIVENPKWNHFYDAPNAADPYASMSFNSIAITSRAHGPVTRAGAWPSFKYFNTAAGYVIFDSVKPEGLDPYAFAGDDKLCFITLKYKPMDNEKIASAFIFKDDVQNIYVTLKFVAGVDDDEDPTTPNVELNVVANAVIPTKAIANVNELIAEIKTQNANIAEFIDPAIDGKTLEILNGSEVITPDKITGEMFLTINVK